MAEKTNYTASELYTAIVKGHNLPSLTTHDLVAYCPTNPEETYILYGWDEIGMYDVELCGIALYKFIKH